VVVVVVEVIISQLFLKEFEVEGVEVVLVVPLKIKKNRKRILFQRNKFEITIGGGVGGGGGRCRI